MRTTFALVPETFFAIPVVVTTTSEGVPDAAALRAMGADAAYRALMDAGERPHFIGYYVLHMALQGRPWNDCKGAEKAALRARFDALVGDRRPMTALEAALDQIGLRRP